MENNNNDKAISLFKYKIEGIEFSMNTKDLLLLENFSHLEPKYDAENGIHLHIQDKVNPKYVQLGPRVTNVLSLPKWDKLSNEEFRNLSDKEYENFLLDYLKEKSSYVKDLIKKIYFKGFQKPSIIQSLSIIPLIQRKNAAIQFHSGNGKTMSFLIGLLWNFDVEKKSLQCIFITSTHEIAHQIYNEIISLLPDKVNIAVCTGQKNKNGVCNGFINNLETKHYPNQISDAKKAQIIVGTTGKIYDLCSKKILRLDYVTAICIDEFDFILDDSQNKYANSNGMPNTAAQACAIVDWVPGSCQKVFFSATMPMKVLDKIDTYINNGTTEPLIMLLDEKKSTLQNINHYYVKVKNSKDKCEALLDLIGKCRISQCIIFVNTNHNLNYIKNFFNESKVSFPVTYLSANLSSQERNNIHEKIANGSYRYIVATNIISRGLDVIGVNVVINFDMPDQLETYIHRIGRSGRFNKRGLAISFILYDIENSIDETGKITELNQKSSNNPITELTENIESLI